MGQVLVFGSINIDFVTHVPHIVRPGETLSATRAVEIFMGGKGANQAVAAAKAGADVTFCGAVGPDGDAALANFDAYSVNTRYIRKDEATPTGSAYIQIDENGENAIIVNPNANVLTNAASIDDNVLSGFDLVMMQMEVQQKENFELLQRAHALGVKTMLNLAPFYPVDSDVLEKLDYLIVNEGEFDSLAEHLSIDGPTALKTQFPKLCLIISKGSEGAALYGVTQSEHPALKIDVVDTTGAGDAMCGSFAAALAAGETPDIALKWGVVGGSLACTKLGAQTASPTKAEIVERL